MAVANGLYLALLFLGGMAYPLTRLPNIVRSFAELLPAAALAESVRGALSSPMNIPAKSVIVLIIWAIVLPVAAAKLFRWEE